MQLRVYGLHVGRDFGVARGEDEQCIGLGLLESCEGGDCAVLFVFVSHAAGHYDRALAFDEIGEQLWTLAVGGRPAGLLHGVELEVAYDVDVIGRRAQSDEALGDLFGLCADGVYGAQVVVREEPPFELVQRAGGGIAVEPAVDHGDLGARVLGREDECGREPARCFGRVAGNFCNDERLGWVMPDKCAGVAGMSARDAEHCAGIARAVAVAVVRMVADEDELQVPAALMQGAQQRFDCVEFADCRGEDPECGLGRGRDLNIELPGGLVALEVGERFERSEGRPFEFVRPSTGGAACHGQTTPALNRSCMLSAPTRR